MAIRKIKGSWWVDFQVRGKRYRLRSPDNHREGAIAHELAVRRKLADGEPVFLASDPRSRVRPTEEMPLSAFATEWFETYVKTYLRPTTQSKHRGVFRRHIMPLLGKLPLAAITSAEVKRLTSALLAKGLSPKSVNNILSTLRCCLDTAVEWEHLKHLPRFKWLRADPSRFDFLSSAESRRLIAAATETPYGLMIRMALRTGMRIGELTGLRWEDIDFDRGLIAVRRSIVRGIESSPKTYRHRFIPIASDLYAALLEARRPHGFVFSLDGQRPLAQPRRGLWRALKAAGLRRIGWHVLRHTFASQLATEGVSIYVVQALLGHATVQMTTRYAHLAPSATRGAVEVLLQAEQREALPCQPAVNRWRMTGEQRHLTADVGAIPSADESEKAHLAVSPFAGAGGGNRKTLLTIGNKLSSNETVQKIDEHAFSTKDLKNQ